APQRRHSQEAEDAVAPVEAGRDGLSGERDRHHRQGQDPRGNDVDTRLVELGEGGVGQRDQRHERQDDRDEELLTVAQDGRRLEPRLSEYALGRGRWSAHRAPLPAGRVSRKKSFSRGSSTVRAARVPEATTWPLSMITTSCAIRSASSKECVVTTTQTPRSARSVTTSHTSRRAWGSSPAVGSSR